MIVVLSYREDYSIYRCGYLESNSKSDFEMHSAKDVEDAADWIATRIKADPRADYLHVVCDKWEQIETIAEGGLNSAVRGADSIMMPRVYDDKFEDYTEFMDEEKRLNELYSRIHTLVVEKLK